ncbi:MAG TPA: enoyl-CoA hydratase/isomerase family protein [Conexibacter sp.]|nr:enoyl-CoA hydratase/isomerase family protein [Conexibacter sp.]
MPGVVHVEEPAPGVALLTLSNPDKRNALDRTLCESLRFTLERIDARCVVLTGEGRAFCAGYDIAELLEAGYDDGTDDESHHPFPTALAAIEAYPYPVLAALNGATIGGGLELAIACDLRIAADTVQLGMPPAKLGVVYSTAGLNRFLTTIGGARTRELFLTGRRIDAATAERWGLVNEVVEAEALHDAAVALAREIAGNAPLSLRGNKAGIRELVAAAGALDPVTAAALEVERRRAFESEDLREGLQAFGEKRPPVWQGR